MELKILSIHEDFLKLLILLILLAMILWRCTWKTWHKYIHIHEREVNRIGNLKGLCVGPEWTCLKRGKKRWRRQRNVLQPSLLGNTSLCEMFQGACACTVLAPECSHMHLGPWECGVLPPAAGLLKGGWGGTPRGTPAASLQNLQHTLHS